MTVLADQDRGESTCRNAVARTEMLSVVPGATHVIAHDFHDGEIAIGGLLLFVLTHNLQCMNEFSKAWKGKARPPAGKDPTATFLYIDVTIPKGEHRRSSGIIEMSKLLREYDSEFLAD